MSTTYFVIEVRDETSAAIEPSAAELVDEKAGTRTALSKDKSRGWSVDVSALEGKFRLELSLPKHPMLPFRLDIATKKGAKQVSFQATTPKCCTLARKHATEGDDSSPVHFTATFVLAKQHEEIVFAAGWDFSGGGYNDAYCDAWRDDLYEGQTSISGKKVKTTRLIHDHTVVTLFDFRLGERIRRIKGQAGWHEMDRVLQGAVKTRLGSVHHDAINKLRHDDDSCSITHVYAHVKTLGKDFPGSLLGLHIISHAWAGGPIVVDTFEDPPYKAGGAKQDERDPGDKDGRPKDFNSKNMPDVANFKAAFKAGAIAKIWGCYATTVYRDMVRVAAGAKDKTTKLAVRWDSTTVLQMTATEIEDFFRDQILKNSYMTMMAQAAGITVYGAPPGMGANLKMAGGRNYMFVDQSSYAKEFKWYKDALGLEPDESGHFAYK